MAKKVLFAHTMEIIQFDSKEEAKAYFLKQIFPYKLISRGKKDGKFIVAFTKAYNKAPMLDETDYTIPPSLAQVKEQYKDFLEMIKDIRTVEEAENFSSIHLIPIEINGYTVEEFKEKNEEIEWIRYDRYGNLFYIYNRFDEVMFSIYYGEEAEHIFAEDVTFDDLTEENYLDWFFNDFVDKDEVSDEDYSFETGV